GPARDRVDRARARSVSAGGRELFGDRLPGRVQDAVATSRPQHLARVDPRRDAGSGGAGAARPSAHIRRAHADGDGAAAVRRRNDAGGGAERGGARGDRGACGAGRADRGGAGRGDGGAVRPQRVRRHRARAPARTGAAAVRFRSAGAGAGARGAGRRGRQRREPRRRGAGRAARWRARGGWQLYERTARRADARAGAVPSRGRASGRQGGAGRGEPGTRRAGLGGMVRGRRVTSGADRAGASQPDRRGRGGRPGSRAATARGAGGAGGDRPAARQRARGPGDADIHRIGEQAFLAVRLVGHRRALSRQGGQGGRCGRGYRPDAVELCAGGAHGGFHRADTDEIDDM
ncbi:MAG: Heat-inducible transcription repressor HrcA, partial [uncultured Sphingomonadaceae bacterium]